MSGELLHGRKICVGFQAGVQRLGEAKIPFRYLMGVVKKMGGSEVTCFTHPNGGSEHVGRQAEPAGLKALPAGKQAEAVGKLAAHAGLKALPAGPRTETAPYR